MVRLLVTGGGLHLMVPRVAGPHEGGIIYNNEAKRSA